jgi:hypothetical protein
MKKQEITPGLYKRIIGEPTKWIYDFSPNKIELYLVYKEGENLIATDFDGKTYSVENPGFYGNRRRNVSKGAIDSFDLIQINETTYKELETDLLRTKERTSKLLKMMGDNKNKFNNKANLSAENLKIIYIYEKENEKILDRFYSLSDHLD